jgi:cyclin A
MADKENSAAAAVAVAAAPPRLTRAAAKRAAAVTAVAVAAKRKRVALTQLPTHPNAVHDDGDDKPVRKQQHLLLPASQPKPKAAPAPAAAVAAASDDEEEDPQLCKPYASDIYSYLRSMESQAKRRPATDYIAAVQFDVSPNMRAILVDWLVEVAEEYKLVSDTLYLTVSYIDRFLSANALNRQRLQLLGVSAMLVAS